MVKKNLIRKSTFVFASLLIFVFSIEYCYGQRNATPLITAIRYERGVRLYKQGKYASAIREFERILELDPDHEKAKKYLSASKKKRTKKIVHQLYDDAENYSRQGEHQKAIDSYQEVIEIMQDDGYSLYNIEVLKGRIEKIERRRRDRKEHSTQVLERLSKQTAKKKVIMQERVTQELAFQEEEQKIKGIKRHIDKAVTKQYQLKEKARMMEAALREAEEATAQKDKRLSEFIALIPQETFDDGFSLLRELSIQERINRIRLTYKIAKDYYKKKDYFRAMEAFEQVIALEEGVMRKQYSVYAQRYIDRALSLLEKQIEKEMREEEALAQ